MDTESLTARPGSSRFPPSDHCDGERFFNPDAAVVRTLRDVLRWQLFSKIVNWGQSD